MNEKNLIKYGAIILAGIVNIKLTLAILIGIILCAMALSNGEDKDMSDEDIQRYINSGQMKEQMDFLISVLSVLILTIVLVFNLIMVI